MMRGTLSGESVRNLTLVLFLIPICAYSQRISVQDSQFVVNGYPIWINGANTAWSTWDGWNEFGHSFNWGWWNTHLQLLSDNGINCTRVWVSCDGRNSSPGINNDGYISAPTGQFWSDIDQLFEIAQNKRVYQRADFGSPFDNSPQVLGLSSKPCIIGEYPAKGVDGKTPAQLVQVAYDLGWQGVMPWRTSYNDGYGTLDNFKDAFKAFAQAHHDLVYPSLEPVMAVRPSIRKTSVSRNKPDRFHDIRGRRIQIPSIGKTAPGKQIIIAVDAQARSSVVLSQ